MKNLLAAALLLSLTGCAVYPPNSVAVGVQVGVTYGNPGYYNRYYSPYDSGPFGYSREVQARGSYYSPPIGKPICNPPHQHSM